MPVDFDRVRAQVADLGLGWSPGETVNSRLSPLAARSRTGAVPPGDQPGMAQRAASATSERHTADAVSAAALPKKVDWRSKGGNFVTPVKDQQFCGSCVAFGTVAVLESMVRITGRAPTLAIDLSEAQLFFCYGPDRGAGACPEGGWWPDDAFACLGKGVVDEACFPYTDVDQPCKLGADAKSRLTTASKTAVLSSPSAMKRHLATVGPLSACFSVYEDFQYYYTGGIYRYHEKTSGDYVGGHCVCIVGYDEGQRCWIAKNSWGTGWGESGFFRIGYGECGIDASMWGITGTVKSPALASLQVLGLRDGAVRRIARLPEPSWEPAYETLATPPAAGSLTRLGCAGVGSILHVVGLGSGGTQTNLWHTVRNAAGTWQASFGNVKDPGKSRHFDDVACGAVGTSLHVVGLENGALLHTIRTSTGWQTNFGRLAKPADTGPAAAVSCTGIGSSLHVVAVMDGELWHTVREPKGWQPFAKIAAPPTAGAFHAVSCTGVNGALQVVAVGSGGSQSNLWHTMRKASGAWQAKPGNVRDPGKSRAFEMVSCSGIAGDLHLVAMLGGELWHTIRFASGKWQSGFGHLKQPLAEPAVPFSWVRCAAVR